MEPRYGRLYAAAVLRPFAEQLIRLLKLAGGETAADLICDGGVLTAAMARAAGEHGTVYAVDLDAQLVRAAGAEAAPGAARVVPVVCEARSVPLSGGACDAVASLFTLGFGDPEALMSEGRRTTRAAARAVFVTWDTNAPPAHEAALDQALREAAAHSSPFLQQVVAALPPDPTWTAQAVKDVVRFDGFDDCWSAMVDDRPPLRAELDGLPVAALHAARERCRGVLQRYATLDGALRIPVRAVALSAGSPPPA
jgi:ubiquinone/menaquinone biosynthesis C-methylase UbiE